MVNGNFRRNHNFVSEERSWEHLHIFREYSRRLTLIRLMGDKISRSMKWRYIRRMESLGIVKHSTKKYYRKVYDTISDWMEKDAIPKIRRMESSVDRDWILLPQLPNFLSTVQAILLLCQHGSFFPLPSVQIFYQLGRRMLLR